MKKIMFDDKCGLTKAVLEERKTMTRRRIVPPRTMEGKDVYGFAVVKYPRTNQPIEVMALDADGAQIGNILPKYKVGEVVTVAQRYKDIRDIIGDIQDGKSIKSMAGWNNKMYVRADLIRKDFKGLYKKMGREKFVEALKAHPEIDSPKKMKEIIKATK